MIWNEQNKTMLYALKSRGRDFATCAATMSDLTFNDIAVEDVVPVHAVQVIVAVFAPDHVRTTGPREDVDVVAADEVLDPCERVTVRLATSSGPRAEVSGHTAGRVLVGGGVAPILAFEHVATGATLEDVVAQAAGQGVDAIATDQAVVASIAGDVVPSAATEDVLDVHDVIPLTGFAVIIDASTFTDGRHAQTRMEVGFDLADKYRNPVMILADGMMGQMMEPVIFKEPKPRVSLAALGFTSLESGYVLALLEGKTAKEMAFDFDVTESTARNNISRCFHKLSLEDRHAFTIFSMEHEIVA